MDSHPPNEHSQTFMNGYWDGVVHTGPSSSSRSRDSSSGGGVGADAGNAAGTKAAEKELAKFHMGQDLTDKQVIKLADNPPPCPSTDTAFCKAFRL